MADVVQTEDGRTLVDPENKSEWQEIENVEVWHYAVFLGGYFYMEPACLILREPDLKDMLTHGQTILRGRVNCRSCKTAMGMPEDKEN